MDDHDFRLLEKYLDGTLDEQDLPRLEEVLRTSSEARAQLRTLAMVDAKLHEMAAAVPDLPLWSSNDAQSQAAGIEHRERSVKLPVLAAAVAIAVAVLITIAWTWLGEKGREGRLADTEEQAQPGATHDGQEIAADNAVAVLTRVVDAKWEQSGPALDEGSPLEPGPLKLVSGLAQIEFYSGAMVIVEGPADFELMSQLRGVLREGKLRARVPPQASGFTIDAPGLEVEDWGTEFAMRVDGGQGEIHVIEGRVKVRLGKGGGGAVPEGRESTLDAGRAVRFGADAELIEIDVQPDAFVGHQQLISLGDERSRQRYQRWLERSLQIRKDPATLAYFAFESDDSWSRALVNDGPEDRRVPDGAIIGCPWTQGRWPQKKALEFKRPGDRVRIDIPGQFESLSLVAWVRVEPSKHPYNPLLRGERKGQVQVCWQLTNNRQLAFRLRLLSRRSAKEHEGLYHQSPRLFPSADFSRWAHLATVFDRDAKNVTHYFDGKPVSTTSIGTLPLLHIGHAEIGNAYQDETPDADPSKVKVRGLDGRIDEFAIIGRALSQHEIRQMYEFGTPK